MRVIADMHTHTIASTHAYSTVKENAEAAAQQGLSMLAVTDHAPAMPDAPHLWHFMNMGALPETLCGVKLVKGVEANIRPDGSLDLPHRVLTELDWVIASMHGDVFPPSDDPQVQTAAYLEVAKNPYVDLIGHSGTEKFRYDYETVIKAFKEYGKVVEINEGSLRVREGAARNCLEIARLCKKYEVMVCVDSDAHFCNLIGEVSQSLAMLESIDFPEKLVLNYKEERLTNYLQQRKKRLGSMLTLQAKM